MTVIELPHVQVLTGFNFNKAHKKVSMKPLDFTCILRLSKSQLQENGFKDAVIEKVYQQMLEYLSSIAHSIAFPDTVVPTIIQVNCNIKSEMIKTYCLSVKSLYGQ